MIINYLLEKLENDTSGLLWKWISIKAGGLRPTPRGGVSLAVATNGKGYIFGGVLDVNEDEESLDGQFSNEMHSLDLSNQTWHLVELTGKKEKKSTKDKATDDNNEEMETTTTSAPQGIITYLYFVFALTFNRQILQHSCFTFTVTTDGIFTITVGGTSSSQASKSKLKTTNLNVPSPRMKPGNFKCFCFIDCP